MKPLSRDEVEHLAQLSRLSLTEAESTHFGEQLGSILEYASHLPDLEASPESSHLRLAEDVAVVPINPQSLLRNVVELENGYVKVPAILDKSES